MRVSEFMSKENIKMKRIHVAFARMDKKQDDFHLIPSPVLTFVIGDLLKCYGIGIKIGFWGIGIGFCFPRSDIDLKEKP